MLVYIFDGTFDGLLTCIYEAYYRHETPGDFVGGKYLQAGLGDDYVNIVSDETKAMKVTNSIKSQISIESLDKVYHAYLSELEGIYIAIYQYLKFGWKVGPKLNNFLTDNRVMTINNASRKVGCEAHRLTGLIRFKQLDEELYYASIEPDHNVTELIAPHFASRFANQNWIIHDLKRNTAAVFNKINWVMVRDTGNLNITEDERELFVQSLWKKYFKSISIQSRENPKLQRQFLPGRYWKHLVEKQL